MSGFTVVHFADDVTTHNRSLHRSSCSSKQLFQSTTWYDIGSFVVKLTVESRSLGFRYSPYSMYLVAAVLTQVEAHNLLTESLHVVQG